MPHPTAVALKKMSLSELVKVTPTVDFEFLGYATQLALERSAYPEDGAIPLPEALTADQRKVAEALATRSGNSMLNGISPMPTKVQFRRRWLGLEKPTLLEKTVVVKKVKRPLWWACNELDEKAVAKLLTPKELLRLALELSVWSDDLYGISLSFELDAVKKKVGKPDTAKITTAFLEEVLAFPQSENTDGLRNVDAPGGFDDEKYEPLLRLIISSGGKLKPEWEKLLPFSGDPTLFAAVPEARREALLISAFQNDSHSSSALRTAMEWLPKFPYPAFANAVAARVESRKFELEYEKKIIAMRRANWDELAKTLPKGVWRPLVIEKKKK